MPITLTKELRADYERLFNTMEIRSNRRAAVDKQVDKILAQRPRYEAVQQSTTVPWYFVAPIHWLEASGRFDRHLHNGDPLKARTVQVPAGRPKTGAPPFTWEASTDDALRYKNLHKVTDWSLGNLLFRMEGYNGFGYRKRKPAVNTPYLWSFCNQYEKGKYVADGKYDPQAVSAQCGAAVMLRRLAERGEIALTEQANPVLNSNKVPADLSMVRYSNSKVPFGEELQHFLNTFPGIFLQVDGKPGKKTSDAFKQVTGHYLAGDPRGQ